MIIGDCLPSKKLAVFEGWMEERNCKNHKNDLREYKICTTEVDSRDIWCQGYNLKLKLDRVNPGLEAISPGLLLRSPVTQHAWHKCSRHARCSLLHCSQQVLCSLRVGEPSLPRDITGSYMSKTAYRSLEVVYLITGNCYSFLEWEAAHEWGMINK